MVRHTGGRGLDPDNHYLVQGHATISARGDREQEERAGHPCGANPQGRHGGDHASCEHLRRGLWFRGSRDGGRQAMEVHPGDEEWPAGRCGFHHRRGFRPGQAFRRRRTLGKEEKGRFHQEQPSARGRPAPGARPIGEFATSSAGSSVGREGIFASSGCRSESLEVHLTVLLEGS